tara:strand:+ start:1700 stop:2059 length:360 start_codon:yes stop_codon:yes gene_type:complete
MDKAFDLTSTIKTLRDGISKGYWDLETLDQESSDSAYWRKQALRNVPVSDHGTACFMKPHRNLLRENPNEPIHEIKVTEERDFSPPPRQESSISRIDPHLLLPETQEDNPAINIDNLQW